MIQHHHTVTGGRNCAPDPKPYVPLPICSSLFLPWQTLKFHVSFFFSYCWLCPSWINFTLFFHFFYPVVALPLLVFHLLLTASRFFALSSLQTQAWFNLSLLNQSSALELTCCPCLLPHHPFSFNLSAHLTKSLQLLSAVPSKTHFNAVSALVLPWHLSLLFISITITSFSLPWVNALVISIFFLSQPLRILLQMLFFQTWPQNTCDYFPLYFNDFVSLPGPLSPYGAALVTFWFLLFTPHNYYDSTVQQLFLWQELDDNRSYGTNKCPRCHLAA